MSESLRSAMLGGPDKENVGGSKGDFVTSLHVPQSSPLGTSRHNHRIGRLVESLPLKGNFSNKCGGCSSQSESKVPIVEIRDSGLATPSGPHKDTVEGSSCHIEATFTGLKIDVPAAEKVKFLEDESSAKTLEITELKQHLHETKMRMAEVVAQSAILVRDVQCAASKEITDARHQVDFLLRKLEGSGKGLTCLEEEFTVSANLEASSASSPSEKSKGSNESFLQEDVTATEQDSAWTQRELLDCKLRLSEMQNQLQWTVEEKQKLEHYLRSSVQTALKLQDALMNQKIVMKLEQLAMEEHVRKEAAQLVHSATTECKQLQKQLNEALISKGEVERSLRNCIELLCEANRELIVMRNSAEEERDHLELLQQEKSLQLALAEQQVELERQKLDKLQVESFVKCSVLECIWEGAVKSLVAGANVTGNADIDAVIGAELVRMPCHGSQMECKERPVDTENFIGLVREKEVASRQWMHMAISEEEVTPIKDVDTFSTPSFVIRSALARQDGCRGACMVRSPERIVFSQKEAALRANLLKSEYEVEVLGDKVGEHRIVLEKVALLLEYISTSGLTAHGTKCLMRSIIEQLQKFEGGY